METYYAAGFVAADGTPLLAPTTDGTAGQVMLTDGSGQLSFGTRLQASDITSGTITAGTNNIDFDALGPANVSDTVSGALVHTGDGVTPGNLKAASCSIGTNGSLIESTLTVKNGSQLQATTSTSAAYVVTTDSGGTTRSLIGYVGDNLTTMRSYGAIGGFNFVSNASSVAATFLHSSSKWLFNGPLRLGIYTFATVPTASSYQHYHITITDRASREAYSDGTDWRFVSDDAIIS